MISRIVISSGHGKYVRGASGLIDEVDEARKVVEKLADELRYKGVDVITFHDDVSKTQDENLNRIVDFHNSKVRDLDVSVHFNAFEQTDAARGCEVWYVTQDKLAAKISAAMAQSGFIDRGAKYTSDLFFLNHTAQPSVLLEVCFVDSTADVSVYQSSFDEICGDIADLVPDSDTDPVEQPLFLAEGKASFFGGPNDEGVDADEGLAFIDDVSDAPYLFLPDQPQGTTGLARRLNPFTHYLACRWDYDVTSRAMLLKNMALVTAKKTGISLTGFPADWGPHEDTGRIADLSPSLLTDLGIETDDEVVVIFPYEGDTS